MPFNQLLNAQQLEASIAGPGDANRLYLCSGLATGYFSLSVPPGQYQNASDTWQFTVGPQLDAPQFRRAIGTASFAGLQEQEPGPGSISWSILAVMADFDDDSGKVRVSVTNNMGVSSYGVAATGGQYTYGVVSTLAYDVSILAAIAGE